MTFRNVQIALRFFLIAGFSVSFSFVSRAEDLKRFDASTCNSEGGWGVVCEYRVFTKEQFEALKNAPPPSKEESEAFKGLIESSKNK